MPAAVVHRRRTRILGVIGDTFNQKKCRADSTSIKCRCCYVNLLLASETRHVRQLDLTSHFPCCTRKLNEQTVRPAAESYYYLLPENNSTILSPLPPRPSRETKGETSTTQQHHLHHHHLTTNPHQPSRIIYAGQGLTLHSSLIRK